MNRKSAKITGDDMCDRCNGMTEDEWLLNMLEKIEAHGWAVVGVAGDETGPPFAYTAGLSARGLPELALYGLEPELAGSLLNYTADLLASGVELSHGNLVHQPTQACPGIGVITMTDTRDLWLVREIYGQVEAALQLVWTDSRGRLPWQRNYSTTQAAQPFFGPLPRTRTQRVAAG